MTLRNVSKTKIGFFLALATGLIYLGSCGGSSSTPSLNNTAPVLDNSAPLTAGFGALGPSGG